MKDEDAYNVLQRLCEGEREDEVVVQLRVRRTAFRRSSYKFRSQDQSERCSYLERWIVHDHYVTLSGTRHLRAPESQKLLEGMPCTVGSMHH